LVPFDLHPSPDRLWRPDGPRGDIQLPFALGHRLCPLFGVDIAYLLDRQVLPGIAATKAQGTEGSAGKKPSAAGTTGEKEFRRHP